MATERTGRGVLGKRFVHRWMLCLVVGLALLVSSATPGHAGGTRGGWSGGGGGWSGGGGGGWHGGGWNGGGWHGGSVGWNNGWHGGGWGWRGPGWGWGWGGWGWRAGWGPGWWGPGWWGPGVVVGAPLWNPWVVGGPWVAGSSWTPPLVVADQAPPPPVMVQQGQFWYYCQSPAGYYPYVAECPGGAWIKVPPRPADQ